LSDLHSVIVPLYEVYANKRTGYLDFESFIKFITDFTVFPDVINKSEAHKIFMSLAITYESNPAQEAYAFNHIRQNYDSKKSAIT
jgi:hypothetical protein